MTQAWYPFYWSDYSGKTLHLSMSQHGAYMLFLRWIYTSEKRIPHNQRYSIARAMSEQERQDADLVLSEFFVKDGDEWCSKRAEMVIYDTKNKHENRVNAGKKGGLAKSSNARELVKQSEGNALLTTTTTIYKENIKESWDKSFKEFFEIYPKPTSVNMARESFMRLMMNGVQDSLVLNAVKNYSNKFKMMDMDERKFVKNPSRWLDDGCYLDLDLQSEFKNEIDISEKPVIYRKAFDRYGKAIADTWFSQAVLDDGKLIVKDKFNADWIRNNYQSDMKDLFTKIEVQN